VCFVKIPNITHDFIFTLSTSPLASGECILNQSHIQQQQRHDTPSWTLVSDVHSNILHFWQTFRFSVSSLTPFFLLSVFSLNTFFVCYMFRLIYEKERGLRTVDTHSIMNFLTLDFGPKLIIPTSVLNDRSIADKLDHSTMYRPGHLQIMSRVTTVTVLPWGYLKFGAVNPWKYFQLQ